MKRALLILVTAALLLSVGGCRSEKKIYYLRDGGAVTTPNKFDLYVEYCRVSSEVKAPNASDFYSYYAADEGMVYVDLCIVYKNLGKKEVDAEDVITKAKLEYYDKYEYDGFDAVEVDSRSDLDYPENVDIAPLAKAYIHYVFEVPTEVIEGRGGVVITFTVAKSNFLYEVSKDDK